MVRIIFIKLFKVLTGAGLWLFVGAIAIYSLTGAFYSNFISDGDVMYATTVAIAKHGTVELQPNFGQPQIVLGQGGHYYSKYGLGQSLAAVPFFKLGYHFAFQLGFDYNALDVIPFFFVRFLPILATAATVWLVYVFGKFLYASTKIGIGLAVLYGLGTSAWPYSRYFFSEPLFTLCIFGAAFVLFLVSRSQNIWVKRGWLIATGFLLGYALLVRISGVALLPAYIIYLWLLTSDTKPALSTQQKPKKPFNAWIREFFRQKVAAIKKPPLQNRIKVFLLDGLTMAVGALPVLVLLLWYNYVRFGNIFNNGYDGEGFTTPPWEGFYGLLFSPGKSVFLYSPILLAIFFSAKKFWRNFSPEAVLCGLLIGITVLYYSAWWAWWGGSSWGPRFLVPMLPFAILSLGVLLASEKKFVANPTRALANQEKRGLKISPNNKQWIAIIWLALFPLSVFVQMLGVAPDFNVYTNAVTHGNPALDHLYIFDLDKSPLIAHLKMLRHPETNTIRSLTLGQVGLNPNTAQNISPAIIILTIISTIFICYNYLVSQRPTRDSRQSTLDKIEVVVVK